MHPVTLIWHRDIANTPERDWIRFLLGDVLKDEILDLDGTICRPYSIVVEDNRSSTPSRFFGMAARHRPIGLFHIADEYLNFDYRKYACFDFVMRPYWAPAFNVERILVLPLGYVCDLPFHDELKPASERRLLWSFAGALKSSRYQMVKMLRDAGPNDVRAIPSREQRLSKAHYVELLVDTVFAPCPMGNVSLESHRLYESLEAGCIPIIEKRVLIDYHTRLLENPPFIFVWSWAEARQRMLALANKPAELDRIQRNIQGWWKEYKRVIKGRATALVAKSFSRPLGTDRTHVRVKRHAELPGWRYAELLRHQSLQSLRWRVGRNLLSGRLRMPF